MGLYLIVVGRFGLFGFWVWCWWFGFVSCLGCGVLDCLIAAMFGVKCYYKLLGCDVLWLDFVWLLFCFVFGCFEVWFVVWCVCWGWFWVVVCLVGGFELCVGFECCYTVVFVCIIAIVVDLIW